jgi:hypothetical protein
MEMQHPKQEENILTQVRAGWLLAVSYGPEMIFKSMERTEIQVWHPEDPIIDSSERTCDRLPVPDLTAILLEQPKRNGNTMADRLFSQPARQDSSSSALLFGASIWETLTLGDVPNYGGAGFLPGLALLYLAVDQEVPSLWSTPVSLTVSLCDRGGDWSPRFFATSSVGYMAAWSPSRIHQPCLLSLCSSRKTKTR